jgi:16S rRNA (adenine1518-N6/adenine1519-N6)-dimethyltransferase
MHTLGELRSMLDAHGLAPKKSLGQNFLIDRNLGKKLVDEAGVGAGDLVLEVGPGAGALTELLLERGCEVVACEMDEGLAELLRERFAEQYAERFTLIEGDCLAGKRTLNPAIVDALRGRPFTMVANLPYNAASPLMAVLLTDFPTCRAQYVTIQKEVGDRLAAKPGTKEYGALGVLAQALATVRRVAVLPPECFWPRPGVTSAMIELKRRADPLTDDPNALGALCHALFSQRRKQIGSILGREHPLPEGVTSDMRPERMSVEQFCELARAWKGGDTR